MADAPISEELTTLRKRARRRLVGAVALVLVALAVLWSVMDDKPPQALLGNQVAIVSSAPALPSVSSPPLLTKPEEAAAEPADTESAEAPPPIKDAMPPAPPRSETPAAKPAESKPAKAQDPQKILDGLSDEAAEQATKAAEPAPKVKDQPKPAEGHRFFLQVGAFADKQKADALVDKIKSAGLPAMAESVHTAKGELTRLRVGPFGDKAEAEAAHAKLASNGVPSTVVGK